VQRVQASVRSTSAVRRASLSVVLQVCPGCSGQASVMVPVVTMSPARTDQPGV